MRHPYRLDNAISAITLTDHFLSPVFSRKDYNGPPMTDLTEIISYVQPTALLGLSTTKVPLLRLLFIAVLL